MNVTQAPTGTDPGPSAAAVAELPEAIIGSLSPSRAADFKSCPLLYRFRTIDRLPEPPSSAAVRGTVVHAALEALYDLPAAERTVAAAQDLVTPSWQHVVEQNPEVETLFAQDEDGSALRDWLSSARGLVANYFALEDPTRLEPAAREELVEVVLDGLRLRGYIDRVDISTAGDLRVVDYKTGSTPREAFEAKALFQMKFYALVLWRTRGAVPKQLKLIYLADTDTLTYSPDEQELERFETTIRAIWAAIARATVKGDFRPSPSKLCNWCEHQSRCPSFGGTPPPFPYEALARSHGDRRVDNAGPTADTVSDPAAIAADLRVVDGD
ncbi:putative RecB family exonuclease [Jatrophihabitans sp. GAS493]|uniref:RecB family exonuclease n=1 Tax=Jatrophihabitans sp. GAS493 TaxID=1907575 RepID=UPI000BB7DAE1|nr:PD-(D/E)XK nuclease family protein [Jatrophihabitans sp. GAS493]SOD73876.1 putative RecB family exonuclease [Jatrophihabitans sp. GAS493]